jgi:hypothetical protein
MLAAGTIRRVRQTLVASNLAEGALVAWRVPEERLNHAFDFMFPAGPVQRTRGGALDGSADRRIGIPALDHAEGAGRTIDGGALRSAHAAHGM